MAKPEAWDVAIAGAGIIGCACAAAAAEAGLRTLLIEAGVPGGGTTAAGMGHIVAMDDSPAQFALTRYSQQLWQQLAPELPRQVEYERCGTLWLAGDEDEWRLAAAKREAYRAQGVPAEMLDARALAAAEPHLRPGLAGAMLAPEDGVLYPPAAAKFFLDRARARGARLLAGECQRIEARGLRLRDGTQVAAGEVIIATGTRAAELAPGAAIAPRKGHLLITDRYPGRLHHQLVELGYLRSAHALSEDSVAFNLQPRLSGQILIGSSRQFGAATAEVEPAMLARMLQRAIEFMPGLAAMSCVRAWTGFRPATPDKLPLIGPVEDPPHVWLAAGHEGLGITTATGTAALLLAQLTGQAAAIPYTPYLPSRKTEAVLEHA